VADFATHRARDRKGTFSMRILTALMLAAASFGVAVSAAQTQPYPMVDKAAQKVIAKYQGSTCQQLAASKAQPPAPAEQRAIQLMRDDPKIRTYFINKIAGPVANKMFECGMIP
jgi:hypothetical protein